MLINNRYQVIRSLGEGGFGQAYLATDTQMPSQRQCVIKQLKPIDSSPDIYQLIQARFQREAAILEQLGENHPQIPRLYAYFTENQVFYLVQEWVEGDTLEALAEKQLPQTESTVREILTTLLPALAFVHAQGIIHRDIKPGNIMLRKGSYQPVLIDFGAVKETMGATVTESNPASSIVIGTPGYMPAEQGAGRPIASSDLYSLALTTVYLLTGKLPQSLPTDSQTGEIVWQPDASNVSADLAAVLTKALRYHPRDRYNSASEMLTDLIEQSTDQATAATQVVAPQPPANARSSAASQNLSSMPTQLNSQPIVPGQDVAAASKSAIPREASPVQEKPWYQSPAPVIVGAILLLTGGAIAFGSNLFTFAPQNEATDTPVDTITAEFGDDVLRCLYLVAYDPGDTIVNFREQPDSNSVIIRPLDNLTLVQSEEPAGTEPRWNRVYDTETDTWGYIWEDLLYHTYYQVQDPDGTSANLRDAPNRNLIAPIDNGTIVQFLGTEGDWTLVALGNRQEGYIQTLRLTPTNCF
ncbi:MAG: protein kinase [Cyanobacteria bacterium P01_C01_bin.121]